MFTIEHHSASTLPAALAQRHHAMAFPEPSGAIAALGRRLNVLMEEHNRLDEESVRTPWDSPEKAEIDERMDALEDEAWALREEALALPARTLADCAVQAAVIHEFADLWTNSVFTDEREVKHDLATIRRAAASIVLALADIGL